MGPRDDCIPHDFIDALKRKTKGFRKLRPAWQAQVASLVWNADTKRRAHRARNGYFSMGYRELERRFGRGKFEEINRRLGIFQVTNWSAENHLTKAYRLSDLTAQLKDNYLKPRSTEKLKRLIGMNGRALRTPPKAISSRDTNGVRAKAWRNIKFVDRIPIDLLGLKRLHRTLSQMLKNGQMEDLFIKSEPDTLARMIDCAGKLIKMGNAKILGRGYVLHRYVEASTGRIYANGISLQNLPREIRKTALRGLYEYDFENCHYAIFDQMTARFGYQCSAIRHYLHHKIEIREGIAHRVGITKDEAKQCLLGLIYGARTSDWHSNAIPSLIRSKASLLYDDSQFSAIAEDVKQGRKAILKKWPRRGNTWVNDMGKSVKLSEKANDRLAHLIQGVEAKALREVFKLYPDEVVLPMHDGFVTKRRIDTSLVEREVCLRTGYRLQLAGELIIPSPDLGFSKM